MPTASCMQRNVIWCSRIDVRVETLGVEGLKYTVRNVTPEGQRKMGVSRENWEGWKLCLCNHKNLHVNTLSQADVFFITWSEATG